MTRLIKNHKEDVLALSRRLSDYSHKLEIMGTRNKTHLDDVLDITRDAVYCLTKCTRRISDVTFEEPGGNE